MYKFFAGEFCWVKGDVFEEEAGLTTRVGRNAIYPVVKGSTLFISGPLKLLSAFVRTKQPPERGYPIYPVSFWLGRSHIELGKIFDAPLLV